jgi:peptidylprolyl isomerase/peptidyl-prolyl cis-trans isomerase B (cyclophilin B)
MAMTGATPCPAADGSSRRVVLFEQAPPTCIDPARTYVAEVQTTGGSFSITLDQQKAPNNVNNFVVLARYHYFDGLPFDQNSPGNYIGSGVNPPPAHTDPGYRVPSEVPTNRDDYKVPGTVIIDNENSGGDGGIWVTLLTDTGVAPRFTIIGHVTAGLDVARSIGQAGIPPAAASSVSVKQIRIVES